VAASPAQSTMHHQWVAKRCTTGHFLLELLELLELPVPVILT
jgi:hypothetical protein